MVSEVTQQTPKNSSKKNRLRKLHKKVPKQLLKEEPRVTNKEEKATEATATEHVETGKLKQVLKLRKQKKKIKQ